ncbi:hypothetical protein [Nocardia sp. NPDC052566]|uniref:hypothetical protein n=1 Tax=Nocardia sp. NPDC052566 TaxID=3364330 RepID=UPI0037CB1038
MYGTESTTGTAEAATLPADETLPCGMGTLCLVYRDGRPVLILSDGGAIPAQLPVYDSAGTPVAAYTAGSVSELPTAPAWIVRSAYLDSDYPELR